MVNDYIKDFQKENMSTAEIVEGLKECQLLFAEYVLDFSEEDHFESSKKKFKKYNKIYENLTPILRERNEELYNSFARGEESFQDYFLSKHTEFGKLLEEFSRFREEFFKNAFKFLTKTFKGIKDRLPSPDSVLFLSECFLMKDQSSIEKLRSLGNIFKNVIFEDELGLFNKELNKLEYRVEEINQRINKNGFFKLGSKKNQNLLLFIG